MSEGEAAEVAAWLGGQAERVVETALARVFLTPEAAFKLKRPVNLGYVDFTTPAQRLWALERELAFNKPGAPDIYRAVRRITRKAGGGLEFDGPGAVVEHVLEMRRFADAAVLAASPQTVDGELAEALGRTIARFHAAAERRDRSGMSFTVPSNARLLEELAPDLGEGPVRELIARTNAEYARLGPLLARRVAEGFSRRCHGDLHLGNILVEDGKPVLFDCIEFNDELVEIDVQYDLAFLIMDLQFRGRRDAAVRVLSAYLDEAARSFPPSLWEGLAALPLMLSVRAAVRAHVQSHQGDVAGGRAYVAEALRHLSPRPPALAAVGGLSGTGKTTFARAIAPAVGPSPGAVILRTDEIRKRLMNVEPTTRVDASAYAPEFYERTYATMIDNARAALKAGRGVILDATFIDPELRARAERLAAECGAPFHGVWLDAPAEVLEARVAGRTGDASDATVEVLRGQIARLSQSEVGWTRADATRPTEAAAQAWLAEAGLV
ncbi:bifunctional aminoglycoside phosphotransferase/ATP-binding protein [Phenylobacterium soli]|uniref:Gluconate kinase n=1 Tax=Phenylobacterium soli TaxID=2170551 RepID=A0A328AIV1_9CAUL|nr:bifunctional aminoglycoside phosphotransferase/ATP-binding protein [Phenylobacterium soli]RAK54441.1 gluconate kinase [Phenylobacterium soli]